jgi:uncharacterized protein
MIKAIVQFSVDRPRLTLFLVLAVTLGFGTFLPRITLNTDPKDMLAADAPVRVANARIEQQFALAPNMIVVGITRTAPAGVFEPDTLGRIHALTTAIVAIEGVAGRDVASLVTTNNVVSESTGDLQIRPALRAPPSGSAEAAAIRAEVFANPLFVERFVSRDGTTSAIYVPLEAGADGSAVATRIRAAIAGMAMPEEVHLAGDPIVSETLATEVFRQLGIFSPLAGALMFIVLFVMFRNLTMVMLVMAIAMISTVWAMGLHIALGFTVHLMGAMIPVFLMAIATDSIHIFNELQFQLRGGASKRDAILGSMATVGRPVVFSDLTTAAGFAALATIDFPAIRMFGIFVAVGTLGILVLSFTLVPALLSLTDERRIRAHAVRPESHTPNRLLAALGRFAVARSRAISVVALLLLVVAGFGALQLRFNNNMVEWFRESSTVRSADRALNERLGGTSPGYLVLAAPDGYFQRPEGLRLLEAVQAEVAQQPQVGKVVSIADVIKHGYSVLTGRPAGQIPDSEDTVAQLLLVLSSGGRPQEIDNLIDYAHGKVNLSVQLKTWDVDAFERVVAAARAVPARLGATGVTVEPGGMANFNLVWNQEMLVGMLESFAWGLVMVLLLLMVEYRSLLIGAIAFIPLLFTTAIIFGALGIIGKDFDMPISVLATLTLGLADDFAIHFVSRLRLRLADPDAGSLDDALRWTIARPGLGIIRNAIVFSVAFFVMAFAGFAPYVTVGILMATIMLLSSIATLVMLPALFKMFPRIVGAASRGTQRHVATAALVGLALLAPTGARAQDAEDIARKSHLALYYPGEDFRATVTMKLTNKGGDVRERQLTMLRGNTGEPGGNQRYLILFHKPQDVRRTSFLVWKYPEKDDDRWLFLPAVDLVRRIAASDRRSSFVGSDFTYEDISGRDLSADRRKLLRRETLDGADCFVIESTPRGDAEFARRLSWIDAESFMPRKEEYYDRHDRLFKVFSGEVIQMVEGHPTMLRRSMRDVSSGHATIVEMAGVDYDLGIEADVFTERYLRRPPARWIAE